MNHRFLLINTAVQYCCPKLLLCIDAFDSNTHTWISYQSVQDFFHTQLANIINSGRLTLFELLRPGLGEEWLLAREMIIAGFSCKENLRHTDSVPYDRWWAHWFACIGDNLAWGLCYENMTLSITYSVVDLLSDKVILILSKRYQDGSYAEWLLSELPRW